MFRLNLRTCTKQDTQNTCGEYVYIAVHTYIAVQGNDYIQKKSKRNSDKKTSYHQYSSSCKQATGSRNGRLKSSRYLGNGIYLNNVHFTDDQVIIEETEDDLQLVEHELQKVFGMYNLKILGQKTKIVEKFYRKKNK